MQSALIIRRRLLQVTYLRYVEADRALALALQNMRSRFPPSSLPHRGTIGEPGSQIRRLHERRDRAILQLQVARTKLEIAKARLDARRSRPMAVLLLSMHHG